MSVMALTSQICKWLAGYDGVVINLDSGTCWYDCLRSWLRRWLKRWLMVMVVVQTKWKGRGKKGERWVM